MIPSDDVIGWMFDTYTWYITNFGGFTRFRKTRLITPTREDFPISARGGQALASEVFGLVLNHAGMADWPCELEVLEEEVDISKFMGDLPLSIKSSGAAGTFSRPIPNQRPIIKYKAEKIENTPSLIATFAHELCHYLLCSAPSDPPGGPKAREPATDLGAIFLGFGIFLCNTAFQYEQYTDGNKSGWRSSRQGYLNEVSLAYALAIFSELLEIPPTQVTPHLKTNPRSFFNDALKDLHGGWATDLKELRSISP